MKLTIATKYGPRTIRALRVGELAVHRRVMLDSKRVYGYYDNMWDITLIANGLIVVSANTRRDAIKAARLLDGVQWDGVLEDYNANRRAVGDDVRRRLAELMDADKIWGNKRNMELRA